MYDAPTSKGTVSGLPKRVARPYQLEAIERIDQTLANAESALCVLPTGCGKTFVMARVVEAFNSADRNVLLLAHRVELLEQAQTSFADEIGHLPVIEQGPRGHDSSELFGGGGLCVIGSVQTMVNVKRREKYAQTRFDLILIDEAHHATAASYRTIVDYFRCINPACKVVGVTATPRRADNTALGLVFQEVAYAMTIDQAIDGGWLVPVEQEIVVVDSVDFGGIRTGKNDLGEKDFRQADLETVMLQEEALHGISVPTLERAGDTRQALIFTAGVAHAHMLADILNRHRTGSAVAIDGTTDKIERRQAVREYQRGGIQFLCNFGVFTEGFDAPATSLVVMARPTKSQSLYVQMLGRGTRPLPGVVDGPPTPAERRAAIAASRKPSMLAMDFVGANRLGTCTAVDILGGNYSPAERDRAKQILADKKKGGSIDDALKEAKAQLISEAESRARRNIRPDGKWQSHRADLNTAAEYEAAMGDVQRGGCTDGQIGLLMKYGWAYPAAAKLTKQQAGAVIDKLVGGCTIKQQQILRKYGYDPKGHDIKSASALIDRIAAAGWRRPDPE